MSRLDRLKKKTEEQEGGWQTQVDPIVYVKLSDIKTDPSHQHRAKVDQKVIDEYAEILKAGGELGAIKLIKDGPDLWLWDGHQTLAAARQAGIESLKAEIERGSKREAWKKSLGANYSHGVRRNNNDLANAIRSAITDGEIRYSLLNEDGEYTYTSVARLVRTSKTSIRNHWQKYLPEIDEEIDEALKGWKGALASQKEIAADVAKVLYVPAWVVEQRQIEVAFNLSRLDKPEPAAPAAPVSSGKLETGGLEIKPPAAEIGLGAPSLKLGGVAPSVEIKPPAVEVGGAGSAIEIKPSAPTAELSKKANDELDLLPEAPKVPKSPLHSSESNEWYTPNRYIEAARRVLGVIDLDPASCDLANETVQANLFFTVQDDGLSRKWQGNIFLNPPYGQRDGQSNQALWTEAAIKKYRSAEIEQAILLVNAVPGNRWFAPLWDYVICFPNHRIRFYNQDGEANAPTHSNAFIYIGPNRDRFAEEFAKFGAVVMRYQNAFGVSYR